jgi:hypothetical protein
VEAFAGPAVPSRPERASRTGGTLVIDAFFMGAADNPVGHDNRLGSGLGDECLRLLPSPGVTRLQRYYKPLRHPTPPSLSLAGVWLVIPDHALGLPVLRTLSLCTCCRQYPGAAAERRLRSSHPAVTAFPEIAVGSACTSSFSRLARRSLALRPAHSRRHLCVTRYAEGFSHFVISLSAPVASRWSVRRVGLSPTGKRGLLTAHVE